MNWTSAGDLGDIVVALATAKHAAPKSTLLLHDDGRTKGIVKRQHLIAPLVESQPYITACRPYTDGDRIDWPSEQFRRGYHRNTDTLLNAHARHALAHGLIQTLPDSSQPWLTITASSHDRVIVNRTDRYQSKTFPWRETVEHYGKQILFIGLPHEHRQFCNCFGEVEYQPTKDLLEVAKLIAGSRLFIGNQSSAMTIAEGLKHPRVQEVADWIPDCIYPGSTNAQYVATGSYTDPLTGQAIGTPVNVVKLSELDLRELPRGGWSTRYKGHTYDASTPERVAKQLVKSGGIGYESAMEDVFMQALARDPSYFKRHVRLDNLTLVVQALLNAGYTQHPVFEAVHGDIKFTL